MDAPDVRFALSGDVAIAYQVIGTGAIACAREIPGPIRALGLEIRVGGHTGECERVDGELGGLAVSIGARVAAEAEPGEVLVSGTVRDLVAGSGIDFVDRGERELEGVPGRRHLYAVADA